MKVMVNMKRIISVLLVSSLVVISSGTQARAGSAELKAFSKFLTNYTNGNYGYFEKGNFKYFAVIDINKDGKYEIIGSNYQKQKKYKKNCWINLAVYDKKDKEVGGRFGVPADKPIIYHSDRKGILIRSDVGGYSHETLDDDYSSAEILTKYKQKGKIKYYYYKGNMSGEGGIDKKISEKEYKKYLRSSDFNEKAKGNKVLKFYKNTAGNRKKLASGKLLQK